MSIYSYKKLIVWQKAVDLAILIQKMLTVLIKNLKNKQKDSLTFNLKPKTSSGFTLVEMVVVFAVIIILTGGVILYSSGNRSQIALIQEQYRLINSFSRAKFLTLQFYQREIGIDCGYGVHLNQNSSFFIYKDKKIDSLDSCQDVNHSYKFDSSIDEIVKDSGYEFSPLIKFKNLAISDILFVAPYGHAMIVRGSFLDNEATIEITTAEERNSAKIKVNKYGQISTD